MVEPPRQVSVVSVVALNDLHLQLDFDDGLSRTVDVTPYVQGPQFKQVRLSEKFFKTAHIESGTVVWDNGVMLDADLLRYGPPKPPKAEKPKPPKLMKIAARPAARPVKVVAKPVKPVAKVVKVKAKAKPVKAKPPVKAAVKKVVKVAKKVAKPVVKAAKAKPAKPAAKKVVKKKK